MEGEVRVVEVGAGWVPAECGCELQVLLRIESG